MATATAHPRIVGWVLRNLPLVLLLCVGYFASFSPLWGPSRAWKWMLAASLVPALCLGLDLRTWQLGRRRRHRPGTREAQARAAWPTWRRVGAIYAGVVIAGIGFYQSLGIEADVGKVPLISGLCLIVSLGIGIPLVIIAWPRERWRRSAAPPRVKVRGRTVGEPPRGMQDTGKGTSIRVPTPPASGHAGVWGGFGTKPAPRVWTPGRPSAAPSDEPVPPRFRRLRLLRRPGLRRTRAGTPVLAMAVTLIALVAAALVTYGCMTS